MAPDLLVVSSGAVSIKPAVWCGGWCGGRPSHYLPGVRALEGVRRCPPKSAPGMAMAMARSQHFMRVMEVVLLAAVCFGCAQVAAAAAASSETQVLLNFKASILDGGGDLANWLPGDPSPCSWTGVRCSAGVVTELSLCDMNVTGTVPIGLGMKETPSIRTRHGFANF